ncbi:hypothetical protein AFLA_010771 [Aspergillus flavus NRRL3357]|nr:hypothetical protein AFLA_010771 [Aspergillus flavus NRRL3357]
MPATGSLVETSISLEAGAFVSFELYYIIRHTINPPQNWVQSRASCPSRSLLTGEGIPRGGEMGIQRLGRDSKTEKVCGSFIRFPWDQDRTNHEHVKPSKLRTEKVI